MTLSFTRKSWVFFVILAAVLIGVNVWNIVYQFQKMDDALRYPTLRTEVKTVKMSPKFKMIACAAYGGLDVGDIRTLCTCVGCVGGRKMDPNDRMRFFTDADYCPEDPVYKVFNYDANVKYNCSIISVPEYSLVFSETSKPDVGWSIFMQPIKRKDEPAAGTYRERTPISAIMLAYNQDLSAVSVIELLNNRIGPILTLPPSGLIGTSDYLTSNSISPAVTYFDYSATPHAVDLQTGFKMEYRVSRERLNGERYNITRTDSPASFGNMTGPSYESVDSKAFKSTNIATFVTSQPSFQVADALSAVSSILLISASVLTVFYYKQVATTKKFIALVDEL